MVRQRQASIVRKRGRSSPGAALPGKRSSGATARVTANPPSETMDRFRRMIAGEHPPPPMVALLRIRMLEVEAGGVVFGAEPSEEFYNGMGVVHGGLAATLLDSALGCAINTLAPRGKIFTSLELKVNFTRPLRREVGPVRCEAKVIHMGSRVATAEGRVGNGKIYAHGTATCIVVGPTLRKSRRP